MTRAIIAGCLVVCFLLPTTVHAQSYRKEINTHVVDPCVLAAVRHHGLDDLMDEHEAVVVMKMLMEDNISDITASITTLIRGKDRDTRMQLYPVLRGLCVESMLSGGN